MSRLGIHATVGEMDITSYVWSIQSIETNLQVCSVARSGLFIATFVLSTALMPQFHNDFFVIMTLLDVGIVQVAQYIVQISWLTTTNNILSPVDIFLLTPSDSC